MLNHNMFSHSAPPPTEAIYHQHVMPPSSGYPAEMSMQMPVQQPIVASTYPAPDMPSQAADTSADITNHDDDAEGAGKRRRVQRACDVGIEGALFNIDPIDPC